MLITGTVVDSAGNPAPGAVIEARLSWEGWMSPDIIARISVTSVADISGNFTITLTSNSSITPANSFYTVTYRYKGRWDSFNIVVIPGNGPTNIVSLIVSSPPLPAQYVIGAQGPTGPTGPTGPQGPPGNIGNRFTFNQNTPSSVWNINHNLATFPTVTVLDSAGDIVFGDVLFVDANNVQVTFASPFAGTAYLL